MKVLPDLNPDDSLRIAANMFTLPQGLIGFSAMTHAELLCMPEHLPFLWLKLRGAPGVVNFVVLEPGGFIPDYELELFDGDAASLDIADSTEAMVLNVVTLNPRSPLEATVNLIGPIVINRRTRVGRQLVIANYSRYSARHRLVLESPSTACMSA
jgi:flagellar assembly factor FliW